MADMDVAQTDTAEGAEQFDAPEVVAEGGAADVGDAAAPTPEEEFLMQVLSDKDIADLRAAEQKQAEEEEAYEEMSPEERQAKAEHDALAAAFAMIRSRSNAGKLTTPGTWAAEGLVPDHLVPVDFCDIAFDAIIAAQAESAKRAQKLAEAEDAAQEAAEKQKAASGDGEQAAISDEDAAAAGDAEGEAPGDVAESSQDEAPAEVAETTDELDEPEWQLDDIKVLEGKQTYLYSSDYMTDTYAHWAFLAEEGDDALTLADNARSESRLYPRPMLASSLMNKPYFMTREQIEAAWNSIQESGAYPDIKTCSASNGDNYFYSTDYLSDAQAKALAEWYSVERYMNV